MSGGNEGEDGESRADQSCRNILQVELSFMILITLSLTSGPTPAGNLPSELFLSMPDQFSYLPVSQTQKYCPTIS